jgi:hypothetical protein
MQMEAIMIKAQAWLLRLVLACAASLAVGGVSAQSTPDYDYTNWTSVPFVAPEPGTETFLRSYSETVDGTLTTDIIESFWLGGDGYMYVNVVANNALVGSFRYAVGSGSSEQGGEPFYPPGGSEWEPPTDAGFYDSIPAVPEPGVVAMVLAGGALVLWRRHKKPTSGAVVRQR